MRTFLLDPRNSSWRWVVSIALTVAAVAHVPVIREHLVEAPYMGILFIVLTVACLFLGGTVLLRDSRAVYALTVLTCTLAVLGYAATRIVAFPQLADDVGNWGEPLGLASIASEAFAAFGALVAYRGDRRTAGLPTALPSATA